MAVDGRGDVVAAGHLGTRAASRAQFAVVKLKGATGTEVWRRVVTGGASGGVVEEARAVAVERAGNVVVAGQMTSADDKRQFVVVKLDGNGGTERWRRVLQCDGAEAVDVTLDADGNVVAAGAACPAGDPACSGTFTAVDPAGDALVGGRTRKGVTGFEFTVVKLDGRTSRLRAVTLIRSQVGELHCSRS